MLYEVITVIRVARWDLRVRACTQAVRVFPSGKKNKGFMRSQVIFPTLGMLAVLTLAAMSTHTVSVMAPVAAPEIGVAAAYIGAFVV